MNVCVASLHPRVLSGEIDSLAGLAQALVGRGHRVSVVAPFNTIGLLHSSLTSLDQGPPGLTQSAIRMLGTLPRVIANAGRVDVLHLSLPTPAFSWVGDLVQECSRAPVVVGFEAHLASASQTLAPARLGRAWKTYLPLWVINNGLFGRLSLHRCPAYVVSSDYQRQELLALGVAAKRTYVIPNVIEQGNLDRVDQTLARRRLRLPAHRRLIGYFGHFNDGKGVDVLAEAFALLAERDTRAQLVLAWSGQGDPAPVRRHLDGLESRVNWLQKVHVGTFLSALDVLALPFRSTAGQEAFPTALLEGLQVGCPLVTSDLPLLREMLPARALAALARPNDPADLSHQLERLLANDALCSQMAEAERSVSRDRFAPQTLARRYELLYRWVARRHRTIASAA